MDWKLLAEAGRIVGELSPGKRETVREITIDASNRGSLTESSRQLLHRMTGSSIVAEVISAAIDRADAAPALDTHRTPDLPVLLASTKEV